MSNWVNYLTVAGAATLQTLPTALTQDAASARLPRVRISVEAAPIRFTLDGTDPVAATTGELAEVGDVINLYGGEIAVFEFINETVTNASLKCHAGRGSKGED